MYYSMCITKGKRNMSLHVTDICYYCMLFIWFSTFQFIMTLWKKNELLKTIFFFCFILLFLTSLKMIYESQKLGHRLEFNSDNFASAAARFAEIYSQFRKKMTNKSSRYRMFILFHKTCLKGQLLPKYTK